MFVFKVICIILVVLDLLSAPIRYQADRHPRPAWKKSYALFFNIVAGLMDIALLVYIYLS